MAKNSDTVTFKYCLECDIIFMSGLCHSMHYLYILRVELYQTVCIAEMLAITRKSHPCFAMQVSLIMLLTTSFGQTTGQNLLTFMFTCSKNFLLVGWIKK